MNSYALSLLLLIPLQFHTTHSAQKIATRPNTISKIAFALALGYPTGVLHVMADSARKKFTMTRQRLSLKKKLFNKQ